ncbi:unnamed protein product [Lymnaea stagnalis]|uniref:Uncharacterized protein n=1 Tax=Lymnaea stagnalis TaxID=6523 RepID=A0AAV2I601_LYMST
MINSYSESLNLILGLSIGLSLFVLLFTSVGIIVCCWKKKHSVKKVEWSEPRHLSDHQHQIRGPILDDAYLQQSTTRNDDYHGQTQNEYLEISTGTWHSSALSYQHPKTRIASPSSMFPSETPLDGRQRDTKYRGHPRN